MPDVKGSDPNKQVTTESKIDLARSEQNADINVIMSDVALKSNAEELAWSALAIKLQPRPAMCYKCKGNGTKINGDTCILCQGTGAIMQEADMRAIDLVLAPKFPRTMVNLNRRLDDASAEDLLKMIEGID